MYVPNYIPEPLEVPGNVTLEEYRVRLRFVRQVTLLHFAGVCVVSALTYAPLPQVGILPAAAMLAGMLLLLDGIRIRLRGSLREAVVSSAFLPLVLVLVALLARELRLEQWPVWPPLAGLGCAVAYTLLCGRDYSFVGCFLLAFIASGFIVAGLSGWSHWNTRQSAFALGSNGVILSYFVYDLASLQSRRRRNEVLASVVDLYRDVFNVFGYVPRVIGHWRKHRIWNLPRTPWA